MSKHKKKGGQEFGNMSAEEQMQAILNGTSQFNHSDTHDDEVVSADLAALICSRADRESSMNRNISNDLQFDEPENSLSILKPVNIDDCDNENEVDDVLGQLRDIASTAPETREAIHEATEVLLNKTADGPVVELRFDKERNIVTFGDGFNMVTISLNNIVSEPANRMALSVVTSQVNEAMNILITTLMPQCVFSEKYFGFQIKMKYESVNPNRFLFVRREHEGIVGYITYIIDDQFYDVLDDIIEVTERQCKTEAFINALLLLCTIESRDYEETICSEGEDWIDNINEDLYRMNETSCSLVETLIANDVLSVYGQTSKDSDWNNIITIDNEDDEEIDDDVSSATVQTTTVTTASVSDDGVGLTTSTTTVTSDEYDDEDNDDEVDKILSDIKADDDDGCPRSIKPTIIEDTPDDFTFDVRK